MPSRATACCGSPVISRWPNHTRPEVGVVSPEMSRKNVVLPAPLGPMIERSSPRRTATSTRSTAMRLPKARVSASVRSRGASGIGAVSTEPSGVSRSPRPSGALWCAIVLAGMDALPLPPLSGDQAELVARMAELARTRFAPRAARHDAESSFPHENYRDLHAAGLLPLAVPRAYGGVGADPIAYVHALREMARGCSATALTFNMHSTITGFIDALGTEAQKRRWLAEVVARGSLLGIDLSGCALGYAAVYRGIGEAACDYMLEYAKTKTLKPSTEPMSHHPLVQRTVAEVGTALRAARLLMHEAARVRMDGTDKAATMLAVNQAKAYAAEVGLDATTRALQLAGGRGILKELPLERWHRDALAGPVMPPSNDRCLETAGKLLCGLRAATLEFQ